MALLRRLCGVLRPVGLAGLAQASAGLASAGSLLDAAAVGGAAASLPWNLHPDAYASFRLASPIQAGAPQSVAWPAPWSTGLTPFNSSCDEWTVRKVLAGLQGAEVPEADLQALTDILQQHRATAPQSDGTDPAVYSIMVQCGRWRVDNDCGKEGDPARALFVFEPRFTDNPKSSFQGVPGWQLAPSVYKIDAGGRVLKEQWTNGSAFEKATTCKKFKKYKKSSKIMGGSHDNKPLSTWMIKTFGKDMQLWRSKQNEKGSGSSRPSAGGASPPAGRPAHRAPSQR